MTIRPLVLHRFSLFEWAWGLLYLALVGCLGCSGVEPGKGADLWLRVDRGQLVRAEFPHDEGGPKVTFADFRRSSLRPGEGGVPLSGRTEGHAFAVRVGLKNDGGFWTIPVDFEDPAVEGELTWATTLYFSEEIAGEEIELLLQAVDGQGRGGPHQIFVVPLVSTLPAGALAVRLEWDANADVDLWITDPNGVTLSPKNISDVAPDPGQLDLGSSPTETFGHIDIDSNANCQIDGARREIALWEDSPPVGTFRVGVDLASPCATERTSFSVSVWIAGQLRTTATGNLFAFDARRTANGDGMPIPVMTFELRDGELQLEP